MPIQFFQQSDSAASPRIPFVEDYVEKNKPPYALLPVMSVRRTRKRTGYMVECEAYCVFMFEGSQVLGHLLEALNLWIETKQGYQLFMQAQAVDPYYQLGVDQEKPALCVRGNHVRSVGAVRGWTARMGYGARAAACARVPQRDPRDRARPRRRQARAH